VTLYLLDENVLKEMRSGGDKAVAAWLKTVDDADLRLSALTFLEKRIGCESQIAKGGDRAEAGRAGLEAITALEAAYANRILPIDEKVAAEWARLLGAKQKNQRDMALAATARVHDIVLVTRNVKDFAGRGVRVLNPFKTPPVIAVV